MSETTNQLIGELANNEYEYVACEELCEHPKNEEIYGELDPEEGFVEDIERNGVETPLLVNEHEDCPNTVIGGHRRLTAAKEAGLNRVPVRWVSYPEPMATRRVVLNNNQRDKTPGQQTREMLALEETARTMAKERQGERTDIKEKFPEGDTGQYRDEVGEIVGVSGRTVDKATDVYRMAYPDEYVDEELHDTEKYDVSEDVREVAREQVELMDEGQSFSGAYNEVQDALDPGIEQFTSQETDEWSSPPEVVRPIDNAIAGFDLDPCSGAETSPFAAETYTEDDDGLSQSWFGDVWVNPPYSEMSAWSEKAVEQSHTDDVNRIVFLCKGDSSTQWWQDAINHVSVIAAIEGRLSFGDGENSAPFPSHILVFGEVSDPLLNALADQGVVMEVI